ncbi:MAG: SDR family NAD(P)-dependent oxidoreductase [Clostridia bacterium]|nr:SDR family NAD(P)-dependent oxidoreductase [Clostridia bacterium]
MEKNIKKWLKKHTTELSGKIIAISGATGGIGKELCRYLLSLDASLILLDRNKERSNDLVNKLSSEFPGSNIKQIFLDLEDINSVKDACLSLEKEKLFGLVLNAGAYSIPRHICSTGYENIFQINFVAPYYIARRLCEKMENGGKIVAVSSIAHNYSKTDHCDIDFRKRGKASLVYGNAKRYLTYSLERLFSEDSRIDLSISHPGITFTGITNHYPKLIFAVIKHPMKVIFMRPKKACLSALLGLFEKTEKGSWIGPRIFNIWGYPKKMKLDTASEEEKLIISQNADRIFYEIDSRT